MVLWDTSLPSSWFATFLNKIAIPCPNTLSLYLFACCEVRGMNLDLVALMERVLRSMTLSWPWGRSSPGWLQPQCLCLKSQGRLLSQVQLVVHVDRGVRLSPFCLTRGDASALGQHPRRLLRGLRWVQDFPQWFQVHANTTLQKPTYKDKGAVKG